MERIRGAKDFTFYYVSIISQANPPLHQQVEGIFVTTSFKES